MKKIMYLIPIILTAIITSSITFADTVSATSSSGGSWMMEGLVGSIGKVVGGIWTVITNAIATGYSSFIGEMLDKIFEMNFSVAKIMEGLMFYINLPMTEKFSIYIQIMAVTITALMFMYQVLQGKILGMGSEVDKPIMHKLIQLVLVIIIIFNAPAILDWFMVFFGHALDDVINNLTFVGYESRSFTDIITPAVLGAGVGFDLLMLMVFFIVLAIFGLFYQITIYIKGMHLLVGLWMAMITAPDLLYGNSNAFMSNVKEYVKIILTVIFQMVFLKLILYIVFSMQGGGNYYTSAIIGFATIFGIATLPAFISKNFEHGGVGTMAKGTGMAISKTVKFVSTK